MFSAASGDNNSIQPWYRYFTNEPVEHHPIDEVVDTVDTPSDVTDPDTLINEQSFSQASLVEHHPTASDEATCTTALESTHRTDHHTTSERCHLLYIKWVFCLNGLYYEIFFPGPTVRAQNHTQATESPNDESTCPAVQSTQVTEQEDTGELTS